MTRIPDEAFKAAYDTWVETLTDLRLKEGGGFKGASQNRRALRAAVEAALSNKQTTEFADAGSGSSMSEIPGAAILAAEAAVFDAMIEHAGGNTDGHNKIARAALEAAAPILMAEAFDEGYFVAKEAVRQLDPINPYRSQE